MSQLPTAHAAQSFGARRIDYFAVGGQVIGSDPRAAAAERRIQDEDGMLHEVRLLEREAPVDAGDAATVLRVQSGPDRRSSPVAIVDHTNGSWTRCAPDAMSILARSGVTRAFNWWMSLLAFVLVAGLVVWPEIHSFLTEVNAGLMANVPAFNIFTEIAVRAPGLDAWRLELGLPLPVFDLIASTGLIPMNQLTEWGLGLGAAILAVLAFTARSWRLVYVPVLGFYALLAGGILNSPDASLAVLGVAATVFLVGGFVNRLRDASRFNARVERLAEHVLRNPPQEAVMASAAPEPEAVIAPTAAAASTLRETSDEDALTGEAESVVEAEAETEAEGSADAAPAGEEAANGEAAAPPPAPAEAEAEAAEELPAEAGTQTGAETEAEREAGDAGMIAAEDDASQTPSPAAEADESKDEDLPDEAALAAARAAAAAETGDAETSGAPSPSLAETPARPAAIPVSDTLEDDRTMPVAPPPPMPGPATEMRGAETPAAADAPQAADSAEAPQAPATPAAEVETPAPAAPADDPILADTDDPMVAAEGLDPYAPGAMHEDESGEAADGGDDDERR